MEVSIPEKLWKEIEPMFVKKTRAACSGCKASFRRYSICYYHRHTMEISS